MFLDEIASILDLDGATSSTYSALCINNKGLHVQGKVKITNCSTVRIDILINKTPYCILGEKLKIKNLTLDTVSVSGDIYAWCNTQKVHLPRDNQN